MKSCSELNKVILSRKCILFWDKHLNQKITGTPNKLDWIEFYFKPFRQLWLKPYAWWWDELLEWRKWEETGAPRENPRTWCLPTTKSTWHEQRSIRRPLSPEMSALPIPNKLDVLYLGEKLSTNETFYGTIWHKRLTPFVFF